MRIKIAVCDDESRSLNNIHSALITAGRNLNIPIETYLYTDGNKVVDLISSGEEDFDVLFLDIDMPDISGLEVAKSIREAKSDILLIFISAHEQYVFESIEYNPYRYIRKYRMEQEIQPALKAVYKNIMSEVQRSIIIKTDDGEVRLRHADIMYFDVDSRKLKIYMCDGREFIVRKTIKEMYEELENKDFVKIHSGCVVNAKYIAEYSSIDITLDNGKRLIVSRRKVKDVKTKLMKYWRDKV